MNLPTPTTNQMVFSAHLKTKMPISESMRVITVREKTNKIPRALSGSFYISSIRNKTLPVPSRVQSSPLA